MQGFVHFKKQLYFNTVKLILGNRCHIEAARATDEQNRVYCSKGNNIFITFGVANNKYSTDVSENVIYANANRIAGGDSIATICESAPECNTYARHYKSIENMAQSLRQQRNRIKIFNDCAEVKWKIWQQRVIKIILRTPHPCEIHWIYEEVGNTGKTFLSRFLICAHHSCIRMENAKSADLKYAYNGEQIVMFDLSRSIEQIFNYEALESLKNGAMFSPKYESKSKVYDMPHVIVFANWLPDRMRLSMDRWNIVKLTERDNDYTNNTWNDIIVAHMLVDLRHSDITNEFNDVE